MRIGIIGAGAVGGWYGGALHDAGHDVFFVARGATLRALRDVGLTLTSLPAPGEPSSAATTRVLSVAAYGSPDELPPVDVVINTVKVLPGGDPFPTFSGAVADVPIVTVQNSVDAPERAAHVYGADRVLPGVVRVFATHTGPARVETHPGLLGFSVGPYTPDTPGDAPHPLATELLSALRDAGVHADYWPNIWTDIWMKAASVSSFGVLGALAAQPIGYVRTALREELLGVIEEFFAVGHAQGIPLPSEGARTILSTMDTRAASMTSSMQRDIEDGLPSELDSQIGSVLRIARAKKVPTPLLTFVYRTLIARGAVV